MYIQEDYFLPEDRDGFHIRGMMKRYWAAQLEVLKVIDNICKRHNIKYFAHYGTLLGVIRHRGFIPWDDDTDLGMRRVDYMRFLKYAEEELPEGYILYNVNKVILFPTRVVNSDLTIHYNPEYMDRFHGCPYPAGVDIFVMDNIPDDDDEREEIANILENLTLWSKSLLDRGKGNFTEGDYKLMEFYGKISGIDLNNGDNIIANIAFVGDRLSAMYFDTPTKEVALMDYYAHRKKGNFRIECVDEVIYKSFECIELPVPIGYDEILRGEYGDYMTPRKEYNYHVYGFEKYEKKLFAQFKERGMEIPGFLTI